MQRTFQQRLHTRHAHPVPPQWLSQVIVFMFSVCCFLTLTLGRSLLKCELPAPAHATPLESFVYNKVTYIVSVKGKATISRVLHARDADWLLRACPFPPFIPNNTSSFDLMPLTQRLDHVSVRLHGGGGPLWPGGGKKTAGWESHSLSEGLGRLAEIPPIQARLHHCISQENLLNLFVPVFVGWEPAQITGLQQRWQSLGPL
jgi:hypothetical protein